MIIYDQSIPSSLEEFGIQIPIRDSRTTKTMEALLKSPKLAATKDLWHCNQISEQLERDDLLRAHSAQYVEKLFSDNLEQEIIATYELIDEHRRYYRYDPHTATRPLTELFARILKKNGATVEIK